MTILNEFESKKLLTEFGIKVPRGEIAKIKNFYDDIDRIRNKINSNKYVLKIVSQDIVHKSDVGGVILNIPHSKVLFKCNKMSNNIYDKFPDAKIEGIYIQEMIESGIECIIGIKEDPQFGKVIIFGLGGIYTEIFEDISMRILPIISCDAEEMISETKIYKILKGYRGKKYDIDGIINTIIRVSQMTDKYNIRELDINPLVVHEKDCIALDARILL